MRRAREFVADMRLPEQRLPWILVGVLVAMLFYSYWPSLVQLPSFWDNPQYQHGWIVPVFTCLLLFCGENRWGRSRRRRVPRASAC